jgi:2-polyprenyl-6-methoxyphenol hydroxylase-like FAD-dependent oxidoreductase
MFESLDNTSAKDRHVVTDSWETQVCVAGGGPAGMMLGLLLARAGVDVVVLEKHADFLRDFRGDTIHPSTLEVIGELGLLDRFLTLSHQKLDRVNAHIGGMTIPVADFTHLHTRCRFIAMLPQWDFLNFIAAEAARHPRFRLLMQAEATGLIGASGDITGVLAKTPDGPLEIHAEFVVGADGRHSTIRACAGLDVKTLGAPIDVLWFRLSRNPSDPEESGGYFGVGYMFVMINRGEYWQCGYVIPKGRVDAIHAEGLKMFRTRLVQQAPFLADAVSGLHSWDEASLLTVTVDRLAQWHRPGLLCIGDAAHAMSPVGGVGINLAIQDAVATANLLTEPLREWRLMPAHLKRVQQRRELPTRLTQGFQVMVQNRVIANVLAGTGIGSGGALPFPLRLLRRYPVLRRVPARLIGLGVRPEHVHTPEAVIARAP